MHHPHVRAVRGSLEPLPSRRLHEGRSRTRRREPASSTSSSPITPLRWRSWAVPVPEVPALLVRVAEGQLQAAERLRSDRPTSPALGQERLCAADDIPLSKQVRPATRLIATCCGGFGIQWCPLTSPRAASAETLDAAVQRAPGIGEGPSWSIRRRALPPGHVGRCPSRTGLLPGELLTIRLSRKQGDAGVPRFRGGVCGAT